MHLIAKLEESGKIHPPKWLADNVFYLTRMGSHAYGCHDENSDIDIYGYAIPPKNITFRTNEIPDFDRQVERFEQFQAGHLDVEGVEHDITVYSIAKYFRLVTDNNPNMLDSLFTPRTCVIHSTNISERIREKRKIFLSKKCYHTFKGYAYSQLHKMTTKETTAGSKRMALREKFGYDVKFGLHLVRLVLECNQILETGDLNMQRDTDILKSIRRGEWTEQKVIEWFGQQEKILDKLYLDTNEVPHKPDEKAIRTLLLECLEEHYGNLKDVIVDESENIKILKEIKQLIGKVNV